MNKSEARYTRNGRFTRISRAPGLNNIFPPPKGDIFIELTDLERAGQILHYDLAYSADLLYNPHQDRWEWARLSTDYIFPYSPYAGAYTKITKDELLAKYPTAIEALKKPIPDDICHSNYVALEETDAWA